MSGSGQFVQRELALDGLALDVEVGEHPVEPARHPPRLLAEQCHDGGHERHAHEERVDRDADREAEGDRLERRVALGHERGEHREHDDGGGGDDARRGREAGAHGADGELAVGLPPARARAWTKSSRMRETRNTS